MSITFVDKAKNSRNDGKSTIDRTMLIPSFPGSPAFSSNVLEIDANVF